MAVTPKRNPPSEASVRGRATPDRTSAVVAATLALLTALGIVTIFGEPLAALAVGTPTVEGVSEPRPSATDGGAATTSSAAAPAPSGASDVVDAAGNS